MLFFFITEEGYPTSETGKFRKLMKQDFDLDTIVLPASSVNIGFGTVNALKK